MVKQKVKDLGLDAPDAFWTTDDATLAMITGGCGPGAVGNLGWFDTMWGLSLKEACVVHDFEYCMGTTRQEKRRADLRMIDNMFKIINTQSKSGILRVLRRYRATSYFNAVVEGGWQAFVDATLDDAASFTRPAVWYDVALNEMRVGVSEIPGAKHHQKIIDYHKATSLGAKSDEVPWCSSFVNWCMKTAGISRTNKANARSWLSWGIPLDEPQIGCVVVFKRGLKAWQGHVGFYAGPSGKDKILCLGGNQKNRISILPYPKSAVLGYRWAELKQN